MKKLFSEFTSWTLVVLIVFIGLYALTSYVEMNLNCVTWHPVTRIIFALLFVFVTYSVVKVADKDAKNKENDSN